MENCQFSTLRICLPAFAKKQPPIFINVRVSVRHHMAYLCWPPPETLNKTCTASTPMWIWHFSSTKQQQQKKKELSYEISFCAVLLGTNASLRSGELGLPRLKALLLWDLNRAEKRTMRSWQVIKQDTYPVLVGSDLLDLESFRAFAFRHLTSHLCKLKGRSQSYKR